MNCCDYRDGNKPARPAKMNLVKVVDAADDSDGEKENRKRREDKGALETLGLGHAKYRRKTLGLCFHGRCGKSPNDPKLSDRDPEARVCAKRREAKARHVPGFMAGAHAVTEPVELTAAHR